MRQQHRMGRFFNKLKFNKERCSGFRLSHRGELVNAHHKHVIGVKFTKYNDGFSINDSSRYIDPEGKIISYGYNWKTGDVTYMIENDQNSFKIKFMRALTEQSPIDIASVKRSGKLVKIHTVTGKNLLQLV